MSAPLPFRALAPWLRDTFGRAVHRVALDAGATCPNRDGTKGRGGCSYCDVEGSGTGAAAQGADLARQLEAGLARVARRGRSGETPGAIAYLQSYSNTYVDPARLRAQLELLEPHLGEEVVCVSIATRPDCLPPRILAVLSELARRVPVWVELGLETADDALLQAINRLHTVAEFERAAECCREAGLAVIAHAILGLPGDGRRGARRTARVLARAAVDGVKVHQLMVLRGTRFAAAWRAGELEVLEVERYVDWLADFVERLRPDQVLHRLVGEARGEALLAPRWDVHKNAVRDRLVATLDTRGTRQGSHG